MKKLYKILIAILIALSVFGNIYYFGGQYIREEKAKIYNQGVNDTGMYIYTAIKENGELTIQNGEDILTIIQK